MWALFSEAVCIVAGAFYYFVFFTFVIGILVGAGAVMNLTELWRDFRKGRK